MNEKIKFRNNSEYIIPFIIKDKEISKYVKVYDTLILNNSMFIRALLNDGSKTVINKLSKDPSFDHTYNTKYGAVAVFNIPADMIYLCTIFHKSGESAYDKDMLKQYYLYWN